MLISTGHCYTKTNTANYRTMQRNGQPSKGKKTKTHVQLQKETVKTSPESGKYEIYKNIFLFWTSLDLVFLFWFQYFLMSQLSNIRLPRSTAPLCPGTASCSGVQCQRAVWMAKYRATGKRKPVCHSTWLAQPKWSGWQRN